MHARCLCCNNYFPVPAQLASHCGSTLVIHPFHIHRLSVPALSSIQTPVSDFAQTVKQQADIVKVIEGYIRLRKAGAQNYSGLCPFHKEKSPSFSVHAVRQFYHCFGCQASGDVFSFVGKIENVSFPEAVRIVAQKMRHSPAQARVLVARRSRRSPPAHQATGTPRNRHRLV